MAMNENPEMAAPATPEEGMVNPVIDAIQTIYSFALAQKEKGEPQAEAIIEALKGLVSVMQVGQEAVPEAEAPAEEAAEAASMQRVAAPRGAMPANAGKNSVPVM
jgi:hypothetical protein